MPCGRIILDGDSFDSTAVPPPAPNNGKPPTLPAAPNGAAGGPFTGSYNGDFGTDGVPGIHSSLVAAQNGVNGIPGGNAHNATITVSLLFKIAVDTGCPSWISGRGGNGGPAGAASTPGGDGQRGGNGGSGWGLGRGGNGGLGGYGGVGAHGGRGGAGGDGAVVTIISRGSTPVLLLDPALLAGGRGGPGGLGGAGGVGGAGGKGGAGAFGPSPDGDAGYSPSRNNGSQGMPGMPGRFM